MGQTLSTSADSEGESDDISFSALLELCQLLMSHDNLKQASRTLFEYAHQRWAVNGIQLFYPENNVVIYVAQRNTQIQVRVEEPHATILAGNGAVGKTYKTQQTVAVANYQPAQNITHHNELDQAVKQMEVVAILAVPVKVNDRLIATLSISKSEPYDWTSNDIAQTEQLAQVATLAIRQIVHRQQLSEVQQEVSRYARQLETLQNFNRRLRGPTEIQATAERALVLALEMSQADSGGLYLANSRNPEILEMVIAIRHDPNQTKRPIIIRGDSAVVELPDWLKFIKLHDGLAKQVISNRRSVIVDNLAELLSSDATKYWQSALFVPLLNDGELVGAMQLLAAAPDHFDSDQLGYIEMIGAQIANALQQVMRLQIQKERDQLAAALTLARTAAHELSQPLTILNMELDFVLELGEPADHATFERMRDAVSHMTQQLLEYQKLVRYYTTEPIPGIKIIDRDRAITSLEDDEIIG